MRMPILLMLLLGVSFMFFGCAKKGTDRQPLPNDTNVSGSDASDATELADLFQVDTDKPIGDEGLDMGSPSAD